MHTPLLVPSHREAEAVDDGEAVVMVHLAKLGRDPLWWLLLRGLFFLFALLNGRCGV